MEPLIVVTEVASIFPFVFSLRLLRVPAVVVVSLRVTEVSAKPVMPDDA